MLSSSVTQLHADTCQVLLQTPEPQCFLSPQYWVKTASRCTPPSSTPTSIWSARTPPASPTSAWRSTWTARAGRAPASRRRRACGIAEMPSGSTCTSTAQEHRLHPCSELRTQAQVKWEHVSLKGAITAMCRIMVDCRSSLNKWFGSSEGFYRAAFSPRRLQPAKLVYKFTSLRETPTVNSECCRSVMSWHISHKQLNYWRI